MTRTTCASVALAALLAMSVAAGCGGGGVAIGSDVKRRVAC